MHWSTTSGLKKLTLHFVICIVLSIVVTGCSTMSDDIGYLPTLYRPLEGISPGEIAHYSASQPTEVITEQLKTAPENPRLWEDRGWTYAQSGAYDRAVEDFKRAIEIESNSPDDELRARLLCRLGITYFAMKYYPDAIDSFSTAIRIDEDNWELYFHRWLALQSAGRNEEAEADKQTGLSLKPDVFELTYSPVGGLL